MNRYTSLLNSKLVRLILLVLAMYVIYRFGENVGEFLYYVSHS